jgi:hypothetical protein
MAGECKRNLEGADSVLTWEVVLLPPFRREMFSPGFKLFSPTVYTAPSDFEISGYEGNARTWESFGIWAYGLMESRDQLNEETISKIKNLIQGIEDKKERIRLLYEYMQQRTRYANISIGRRLIGWATVIVKRSPII